jgi:hypothetical protein
VDRQAAWGERRRDIGDIVPAFRLGQDDPIDIEVLE